MPYFNIEVEQTNSLIYTVEAEDATEAMEKYFKGDIWDTLWASEEEEVLHIEETYIPPLSVP